MPIPVRSGRGRWLSESTKSEVRSTLAGFRTSDFVLRTAEVCLCSACGASANARSRQTVTVRSSVQEEKKCPQRMFSLRALRAQRSRWTLKVEICADLEEPRLEYVGRTQPTAGGCVRERAADRERPVAVGDVVGVEVDTKANLVQ